MSKHHQHRNTIEKQNSNLLTNLAGMSTDYVVQKYVDLCKNFAKLSDIDE